MLIIVDNSLEFRSKSFVTACAALGIAIHYGPPNTPRQKGKIEHLHRTPSRKMDHGNPDATIVQIDLNGGASWE